MIETFNIHIDTLNTDRTIRISLPNNYHNETKHYPVLYMHDGQNVLTDEVAFGGVSLDLANYLEETGLEIIIVAIDRHAEFNDRLNEYCPWGHGALSEQLLGERSPFGGKGEAYLDFLVHQLKPLIDSKYRTLPGDTAIAGCSLGALISTYAVCRYPQIFTKAAGISCAFWRNQEDIEHLIATSDLSAVKRFYLDIGTRETRDDETNNRIFWNSTKTVADLLQTKITNTAFHSIEGAEHHYSFFKKRVPAIFSYLYSE